MKKGFLLIILIGLVASCEDEKAISSYNPVDWETRSAKIPEIDSLQNGKSYLSVYSEIYSQTEHRPRYLLQRRFHPLQFQQFLKEQYDWKLESFSNDG